MSTEPLNTAGILAALTPEIVDRLRTAVEIGKWPNGERLTPEQRTTSMQAVMVWEMTHLPEQKRTGYIHKGSKDGEVCDSDEPHEHAYDPHEERPLRLV